MAVDVMLTTKDNPYDPFTQFDEWYLYDELNGHHTCGLIDRLSQTSDELPSRTNKLIIDEAIEWIILNEPEIYTKAERVSKNDE